MSAPVKEGYTDEGPEQTRRSFEALGSDEMSSKKQQQPNLSIRSDPARGFFEAPREGLDQRHLEARLNMERNEKEVPAPVEEAFTQEAPSEGEEQTRLWFEASGSENQKPNLSIRADPDKFFGKPI
jgi:hypothetical protein